MKKLKNIILFVTLIFFTNASIAATTAEINQRAKLVGDIYTLVTIFATMLGVILMILAGVKLKRRADNQNDPKAFPAAIIVTMLSGALIFNYSTSAGTFINSLLGEDSGYCFVIDDAETSGDVLKENCWDSSSSETLKKIEEKVNNMSQDKAGTTLRENINVIIGLFQLIGLIYLIKGIYGLKLVSEGQAREPGYGKPIITILASALIIDLPHTLEMIGETIKLLGFGV